MITSADIERFGFPWSYSDSVQLKPLQPMIVNTDVPGGPGVHWITIVQLSDGTRYIYDPLGPRNKRVTSVGRPIDRWLIDEHTRLYPYPSQLSFTSYCGWFALYVARKIKKWLS